MAVSSHAGRSTRLTRVILVGIAIALSLLALLAGITAVGTRLIERAHPPSGKFVDVAGLRMHVVDLAPREIPAPDETPVVVLHGASGNLEEIRLALGDPLSEHRRVVFIDRPGHGWSERSPDAASPARQADLIAKLLGQLGIARAIIVAHSFAGAVATALALDHPAQIAGLVLLAPVSHPWSTGIAWYYTAAATRFIGPLFAWTLALPVGTLVTDLTVAAV